MEDVAVFIGMESGRRVGKSIIARKKIKKRAANICWLIRTSYLCIRNKVVIITKE